MPDRCPHVSRWSSRTECKRCRERRESRERRGRWLQHREFFRRTNGVCAGCGQPGTWCLCDPARPCGCADMHVVGCGIGVDPADGFAETPVSDDQDPLW